MNIKKAFLVAMVNDPALRVKLAEANECKHSTIQKWLREDDVRLTTATNLMILKEHFGLLEISELLEDTGVREFTK